MSHDEEEVEGGFEEGIDDEELMEPLDDDFAFEEDEERDRN